MQGINKNKFQERTRHWRGIIARADQYAGSHYGFCLQEGIAKSAFYYWKKKLAKLKGEKSAQVSSAFAAVQVVRPSGIDYLKPRQAFIDARWVADLVLYLHGGVR